MSPRREINPRKVAIDLDKTLIFGNDDSRIDEIILREGAVFLLESLLDLDYTLALYTHASQKRLDAVLDAEPDLEDYFDQIYLEEDLERRFGLKDPRIIGAKFLIDDVAPIINHVYNLGLIGILVPEFNNRADKSDQWAKDVLEKIKSSK